MSAINSLINANMLNPVHFLCKTHCISLATGLQSSTFDVSDVARIERKLSATRANSQASKSLLYIILN
jgi:hypothetical protein